MSQQSGESDGSWHAPEVDDAESTHFRPFLHDANERDDLAERGGFYGNTSSICMHSQATAWGMATKITAPVFVALILLLAVFAYIIWQGVGSLQESNIQAKAYPVAKTTANYGRILIAWRDRFLKSHPEFDTATEWRVDEHWLVKGGFITANKWALMMGAAPDATVPIEDLEAAEARAVLLNLNEFQPDSNTFLSGDREMLAAYIVDGSGRLMASSIDMGSNLPTTDPYYWRLDRDPALEGGEDGGVDIDYVADREYGSLLRAVTPIIRNAINREVIGTAIVLFRTDRLTYERREFTSIMVILVVCLIMILTLICWLSARRFVKPLRRLVNDMHAIADGDLSRRSSLSGNDEIGALAYAFNIMAERLRVAKMNAAEANRLDSDLAVAKGIQNSLLPPQTPHIRGLDIFTSYRPAKEIGGDYYDFLPVDNQHMGIVVADASGKSIPAALVMSTTRAILRFVAPGARSAAETLTRTNAILSVDIPRGMFVTAYYLIYDPLKSSMVCASAGHNPLLIGKADGTVELVNPGGIALGFDQGPIFQKSIKDQTVTLASGDRVLMYTDGVVECTNIDNEEYSDRRLQEFLRRHRELSSDDFIGALLADLERHRGAADIHDDTTIVTFKVL